MVYYIYTLTDPIDGIIKYIGKTKDLKDRLEGHISDYSIKQEPWTSKNKWIKWLKNQKIIPIIEILDEGTKDNIDDLERYWIAQFKAWGFRLKNMTEGGDGVDWTGKKHSKETKDKLKKNNPLKKSVVLFDKDFNPLKQFISIRDAERESGIKRQQIKYSCTQKRSGLVANCHFRYASILIDDKEDWKSHLQMREYNKYNLTEDDYRNACKESKNVSQFAQYLNISLNGNAKKILLDVSKKYNIDITHFTFKK